MPANNSIARTRKIFIVTGYSIIFGGFLAGCVLPYLKDSRKYQSQISSQQREIATRFDKKDKFEEVSRNVKLLTLQVRKYDRLVPANQDLGTYLGEISHELDDAGIKEVTKACLAPNDKGKSLELPIEVSGSCTYPQFRQFLTRLEHFNRLSSVSKLSIEADSAMDGNVHIQLTVSIYNTKPT